MAIFTTRATREDGEDGLSVEEYIKVKWADLCAKTSLLFEQSRDYKS